MNNTYSYQNLSKGLEGLTVYYNYSLEILSRNNICINTLTNNEEERF